MEVATSPINVVAALRQSRKGRLSYDRNWEHRNSSLERVIKEVTCGLDTLVVCDEDNKKCIKTTKSESSSSAKTRQKDKTREMVLSPLSRPKEKLASPVTKMKQDSGEKPCRTKDLNKFLSPVGKVKDPAPVLSPVTLSINRDAERDIGNPRCIVMSRDSESTLPSETSLNTSHNFSFNTSYSINQSLNNSCSQHSSQNSSLFIYDTPEIVKYQKYPRVDLPKLRLHPDTFKTEEGSTEDDSDTEFFGIKDNKVVDVVTEAGEVKENEKADNKSKNESFCQSHVEEELVRYEIKCMEDAERRVEERKSRWEAISKEREKEAREKLEKERMESVECEEKEVDLAEIERRVEEKLMLQQQEREERQKELILQAKKEEQIAKEQEEKRKRISTQSELLSPLHSRISSTAKELVTMWCGVQDKQMVRAELGKIVPQLIQESNNSLKIARSKVVEGECGEDTLKKLADIESTLVRTVTLLKEDIARIDKERKEEEEKAQKLQQMKEDEERKAAEAAAAATAAAQAKEAIPTSEAAPVASQEEKAATVAAPAPAGVAVAPVLGEGVLNSISAENKAWYDSIVQFKTDFVKDVAFTEAEKPFKFALQKAVNTPLNSLSGVSSSHLQDKVDKLVQLLSGQQVTVADKTISTTQHPHARTFCLGLAAKKLAKQGEDVVSVDAKSAFPAATLALALWDKYPEFGKLLLAYMFEMCPFLVPFHPQQSAGQTDKSYYVSLGYKYEQETIEKQDKYLKRMSGIARLYAALSVSHTPKSSTVTTHPHPLARVWAWLSSICNLTPHTDITASLLLDVLEVSGHALFTNYGKVFGKLLVLLKDKYFPQLEKVKSEGGPTVRLEQFLSTAIRGQSIKEPEGALRQGFV